MRMIFQCGSWMDGTKSMNTFQIANFIFHISHLQHEFRALHISVVSWCQIVYPWSLDEILSARIAKLKTAGRLETNWSLLFQKDFTCQRTQSDLEDEKCQGRRMKRSNNFLIFSLIGKKNFEGVNFREINFKKGRQTVWHFSFDIFVLLDARGFHKVIRKHKFEMWIVKFLIFKFNTR